MVEGGGALELTHLGSSLHSFHRNIHFVVICGGLLSWVGIVVVCWWGVIRVRLRDVLVVALVACRGFSVMV